MARFFQGFSGAAVNLWCSDPLWRWCLDRLPSRREGYTLDLDSTCSMRTASSRACVQAIREWGSSPACIRFSPCWLEVKLVAGFWLRSGNAPSASNVVAFTCALLARLPRQVRLTLVRAD